MDLFGDDFPHKELLSIEARETNNSELFGDVSLLEKFTQMFVVHNFKVVPTTVSGKSFIVHALKSTLEVLSKA